MEQLDEYNYGARAYAIRALAAIADPPGCISQQLQTSRLSTAPLPRDWEPCTNQLDADQRSSAQAKALQTLLGVCQDPDWSIRYAAVVGLQALSQTPDLKGQIQAQFEQMAQSDSDIAVRARVSLAQQLFHL